MASPKMSMDIGGTLTKLVIYVPDKGNFSEFTSFFFKDNNQANAVIEEDLKINTSRGTLHFIKFMSSDVPKFLSDPKFTNVSKALSGKTVFATGGGAHKYEEASQKARLKLLHVNELDSLVHALRTMINRSDGCFFLANAKFAGDVGIQREKLITVPTSVPLARGAVVVNIGSGVSILHVTENSYSRVGGSSLGGSTFLGLVALLTGVDNFDEALDLAANGDSAQCDMLVRDIYGDNFLKNGKKLFQSLRPTTLASSFGKMIDKDSRVAVRKEDLALSTLVMCSMNLAAIAHIHAKHLNVKHIIFTGNFLATSDGLQSLNGKQGSESIHMHARESLSLHKRNTISMRVLSYAVSYWSGNKTKAVFMKHEGCLGALGAMLQNTKIKLAKTKNRNARL